MNYTLYGDGIHDDHPAIQEMIDSGVCEVSLPIPKKNYLITKPLVLPSNFKLSLPRYAEIKLADNSNCYMITNKLTYAPAERLPKDSSAGMRHFWSHVNDYSPDATCKNIEISGGIWNFNNLNQIPNPERTLIYEPYGYTGDGMFFYGVEYLKFSSLTLKDPVHYGVTFDRVSWFTIDDITFDYNMGNPCVGNMDGVHFDGNCHHGVIRNLKGACYDDLVALNAHEGSAGPITDIEIDGIFATECHSAVRLLTVSEKISNIHIKNVYGSFYSYCIGLTKFYEGESKNGYDAITLEHIYAEKTDVRPEYYKEYVPVWHHWPFIFIQDETISKNVMISDIHRIESTIPVETVYVGKNAVVDNLILNNVTSENYTGKEMPLLANFGKIKNLTFTNIHANGDPEIIGNENIDNIKY